MIRKVVRVTLMGICVGTVCVGTGALGGCSFSKPPKPPEPQKVEQPPAPPPFVEHTVARKGETLGGIARWYTGSVDNWRKIAAANPKLKPNSLNIGQVILIPRELAKRTDPPPAKEFPTNVKKKAPVTPPKTETATPEPTDASVQVPPKPPETTEVVPPPPPTSTPAPEATAKPAETPKHSKRPVAEPTAAEKKAPPVAEAPAATSTPAQKTDDPERQKLLEELLAD